MAVKGNIRPSPGPRDADSPSPDPLDADLPDAELTDVTSEAVTHGEDENRSLKRGPRSRIAVAVLAALTVAVLVVGGLLAVQVADNAEQDNLRDSAAEFAGQQALTLLTVSGKDVETQLTDLAARSTGEFRRHLVGMQETFGEVVKRGKVQSAGSIDAAAVREVSAEKARVLLALSAKVSNAQTKKAQPRHYRIIVDLERKEDQWLVAGMRFVP